MRRSLLVALTVLITWSLSAQPASAQFDSNSTLGVQIDQSTTGDTIHLTGVTPRMVDGSQITAQQIGATVATSLGIGRGEYSLTREDPDFTDEDFATNDATSEYRLNADEDLFVRTDNRLTFSLNTSLLAAGARTLRYTQLEFSLCPLNVRHEENFSREPDSFNGDCRFWIHELDGVSRDAVNISYVETPRAGVLSDLTGSVLVTAAIGTLVLGLLAFLLRLKLRTLGPFNIGLAATLAFLGWVAALVTTLVIPAGSERFDEWALAGGHGYGNQSGVAMLLGLLTAIPFIVPALIFVFVRPPSFANAASGGPPATGPGVPTWMAPPQPASAPAWTDQPAWQQPAPQPQAPAQQAWQQPPAQAPQQNPGPPPWASPSTSPAPPAPPAPSGPVEQPEAEGEEKPPPPPSWSPPA